MAHVAKQQVGVQNAFQWLHVSANEGIGKVGWLIQDVTHYGEQEVLNALTKERSKEFYENWSFVPFNTSYDTMCSWEYMIPLALKNHLQDVKQDGCGLYDNNGHLIRNDVGGH